MKQDRIRPRAALPEGLVAGCYIRVPDAPSAKWNRVLRVYKRKDGAWMVTLRRSKEWVHLGSGEKVHLDVAWLGMFNMGVKPGRVK